MIRVSNADYLARPLRLNPTEASAVIVAHARHAQRRGRGDPADRRPGAGQAGGGGRRRPGAVARSTPAPTASTPTPWPWRRGCAQATARQRQVRLTYYVPARDEESDRVVDPRGVVTSGGLTYLDAWCHSAEAPRLFRLDRIEAAEVLDTPIATPPAAPRDLADGLFARSEDTDAGHPAAGAVGPLGRRVLPGRGRPAEARGSGGGRPPGRRPALAAPAAAAAGPARHGARAAGVRRRTSPPPHRRHWTCTRDRGVRWTHTDRTVRTP